MSRKNKAEKACSAVWKDQSTMAAVAKQKTAQEGQASQGCGDTVHDQVAALERRHGCCCAGSVGSSHEVEASRDMTDQVYTRTDVTPLSEDDTSSTHSDDIPQMSTTLSDLSCEGQVTTGVDTESHEQHTLQAPDSRETWRVTPSPNCYPGGQESLTTPLVARNGSGSIPPIFELECDGNGDDDVFDINCHGDDDDDDDDESSRDRPEDSHMTHDASQPVDIPRFTVSPHASMPASPDTRFFFPPPGGSVPLQYRLTTGSLMCRGGRSISGQSPLGPDNIMVHEALAWAQRLLSPMQQVGDDPNRVRFTSFNPAPQTTSLMTSRDRSQSAPSVMSRSVLERQFGQELRRISDEFHLAYGMGQLRHAQAARQLNGHRPASFPCNHGNPPGWWQLILAYVSPRQLNHHRRCIMETPTESSDPNDPSLAERDQEEDKDPV